MRGGSLFLLYDYVIMYVYKVLLHRSPYKQGGVTCTCKILCEIQSTVRSTFYSIQYTDTYCTLDLMGVLLCMYCEYCTVLAGLDWTGLVYIIVYYIV